MHTRAVLVLRSLAILCSLGFARAIVAATPTSSATGSCYLGDILAPATAGAAPSKTGIFALWVNPDQSAIWLSSGFVQIPAWDTFGNPTFPHEGYMVSRPVTLRSADFTFAATEYGPSTPPSYAASGFASNSGATQTPQGPTLPPVDPPPIPPPTVAPPPPVDPSLYVATNLVKVSSCQVSGAVDAAGALTGELERVGRFSAMPTLAGATAALAGYYRAAPAASAAQLHAVVSAAGAIFVLVIDVDSGQAAPPVGFNCDAGIGTIDRTGLIYVATRRGQTVTGSMDPTTKLFTATVANPNGQTTLFRGAPASANPPRIADISVCGAAAAADRPVMLGFVVAGTTSLPVLVRAAGPALQTFGVTGAAPAARVDLIAGGRTVATNAGWDGGANSASIAAESARIGAFPFAGGSRDAALLSTLPAENYSVLASPADGQSGVVLAEVYDLGRDDAGPRLRNFSARGRVDATAGPLTVGLVVRGNMPKRLLIRGVGPGLGRFGVSNVLAQPKLTVMSSSGGPIASNAQWSTARDYPLVADEASGCGAFALDSYRSDSALTLALAPGAYSLLVSGVDGSSGEALLEVYELW